jgi:hypothetical protein
MGRKIRLSLAFCHFSDIAVEQRIVRVPLRCSVSVLSLFAAQSPALSFRGSEVWFWFEHTF